MISGHTNEHGTPLITLDVADQSWPAVIDTGFTGQFALPEQLKEPLEAVCLGPSEWALADGSVVELDSHLVEMVFDGDQVLAEVTFQKLQTIVVGTHALQRHRLLVDFHANTVLLERSP
jgi:predicted aspartyl protease